MSTRCRAIASLVLTLSLAAGSGWADSVQVDALRVNVRKEPSTASAIVATVSRGEVLEVLDRAGDWYRIKTRSGAEGYVSARLLRAAAPAAGTSTPIPRAAAPETPARAAAPTAVPSPWTGEPPVIAHQDVGCVVAGEFPRLEACFTPAESVGKAQVQFRADEKGPWYYVDMKESGGCRSALLPKPKKDVGTFHYFIEVVDRSFTAVQKPETAPSQSYAPRVVANRRECGQGMMMATGTPTGTVVMGVARDAGGHVLQAAAAHSAEVQASISGFSADGVSMASTGAAPGSAGAGSSTAQSAGGLGTKTLVIAGGVVGAGALVALAAGGGGGSGSSGSGTSGGGGSGQRRRPDWRRHSRGHHVYVRLGHHHGPGSFGLDLEWDRDLRTQRSHLFGCPAPGPRCASQRAERIGHVERNRQRGSVELPGGHACLHRDVHDLTNRRGRVHRHRGNHHQLDVETDQAIAPRAPHRPRERGIRDPDRAGALRRARQGDRPPRPQAGQRLPHETGPAARPSR